MNKLPLFDDIIITADKIAFTPSGIIIANTDGARQIKDVQEVLIKGWNTPKQIKVGDSVVLNLDTFPKRMVGAKNDVGPDNYVPIPPLYEDEEGNEFMIVSPRNLLYVIPKEEEK